MVVIITGISLFFFFFFISEWVAVFRVRRDALVRQGAGREAECVLPYEEGVESPGVVHRSRRPGYVQSVPDAASPPH